MTATAITSHPSFIQVRRPRFEHMNGCVMQNTDLGQEVLTSREVVSIRKDIEARIVTAGKTMDRVSLARDLALLNAADEAASRYMGE